MKKIIIGIAIIFVITGCIENKIEDGIDKLTLIGKYKCLYDSSGIEYTMTYNFSNNKLEAVVNNQSTDVSYSLKNNILTTTNVVTGKEMTGKFEDNKIVFTEKDGKATITCVKQ